MSSSYPVRSLLVALLPAGLIAVASAAQAQSVRYEVLHPFEPPPPRAPYAALLLASDGAFYGAASAGADGHGVIFRYAPPASALKIVHAFNGKDGAKPYAALIEGRGRALYGTTNTGGANGRGTIFRINVRSSALTTLYSFGVSDGSPRGGLVAASDGRLYGAAGMAFSTALYRLDPSTGTFEILQVLAVGGSPTVALIEAADRRLYGVGGCSNSSGGAIYRYDPATSTSEVLRTFVHASGTFSCAPLFQAADGLLYGSTARGGAFEHGVLFRFDPATLAYAVLHHFDGATGKSPSGGLFQAADGALYGTATAGGAYDQGTLYRYDLVASTLTVLHHFGGSTGYAPQAALVDGGDGTLVGTTSGGQAGNGTIYRYSPATNTLATVRFPSAAGATPQADLVRGPDGALYGTTVEGGGGGDGTLFRYDVATDAFKTLHGFDGTHGGGPVAGVIVGADGALYGTASRGGTYGLGTVFRHDVPTSAINTLHEFDGSADGGQPMAALVQASDGALYGTTFRNGSFGGGTLFRYDPATSGFTRLYRFFDDGGPVAPLLEGTDGTLYGTTTGDDVTGPGSFPILFRWDPATSVFTLLKRFHGLALPSAAVVEIAGVLYGTAASQSAWGDVYGYDLATGTLSIPFQFDGSNGDNPLSSLIRGPDGALYGTTERGGPFNRGTLFRFDPSTSAHTVLHVFTDASGANPRAGLLLGPDGALYGTTAKGGPLGGGVLFRLRR